MWDRPLFYETVDLVVLIRLMLPVRDKTKKEGEIIAPRTLMYTREMQIHTHTATIATAAKVACSNEGKKLQSLNGETVFVM